MGSAALNADAVVIGAGPNGLAAANLLADRGWDVVVFEEQPEPGGAVRSGETIEPGFVTDRFSAFYPLSAVSPVFAELHLEDHGLRWLHAPNVLAHPTFDGPAALLSRDRGRTASSLDRFAAGDGASWLAMQEQWDRIETPLFRSLLGPFPPMRGAASLLARLGVRGLGELVRTGLLPVRRMATERFAGAGGGLLLAGCGLHADVTPDTAASGFFGWMLAAIGQGHGWPVPAGGAGAITDALVHRFRTKGGTLHCEAPVRSITVRDGRAVGVSVDGIGTVRAKRAVLADVAAPQLYTSLLDVEDVPARTLTRMQRYQRGMGTFKVNWTLDGPAPWIDPEVSTAGTVHLADSLDELTMTSAQLSCDQLPTDPFVLVGQMTTSDASRSPAGTESMWAYTNVPQTIRGDAGGDEVSDAWTEDLCQRFADRMQTRIERFAPGFGSLIRARRIQSPDSLEAHDAALLGGDKSLGTAQLHQQLVFRPTPGLGRAETPIGNLYLASASAHPGGGVHGACGANAARAAVLHDRVSRAWSSMRTPRAD